MSTIKIIVQASLEEADAQRAAVLLWLIVDEVKYYTAHVITSSI
jgi:hypothetical protein